MSKKLEAVRLEQQTQSKHVLHSQGSTGGKKGPSWAKVPISERKTFVVTSLGYNTFRDTIKTRLDKILDQVKAPGCPHTVRIWQCG